MDIHVAMMQVEFMDEILSSWDKNAGGNSSAVVDTVTSLGGSHTGNGDSFSLDASADQFNSAELDFDISPREGSFLSKRSSGVILGASHSLQSFPKPKLSSLAATPGLCCWRGMFEIPAIVQ